MIEDVVTRKEIERFCAERDCADMDKTLTAKMMCNAIDAEGFIISQNGINNFRALFDRILSYCS